LIQHFWFCFSILTYKLNNKTVSDNVKGINKLKQIMMIEDGKIDRLAPFLIKFAKLRLSTAKTEGVKMPSDSYTGWAVAT
jgi:hypothetical protein